MAGITVNEVTRIRVYDSEGNTIRQGDTIVLRIGTEDILCDFEDIKGGYFITTTCDGEFWNRYRVKSIKKSKVVKAAASQDAENKENKAAKAAASQDAENKEK